MIVILRPDASPTAVGKVVDAIERQGHAAHISRRGERTVIGVVGSPSEDDREQLRSLDDVEDVVRIGVPYKLVSREFQAADTIVRVGRVEFGGDELVVIAGPCAVESREQVLTIARHIKGCGAHMLRGGAFKPRTSPYSFQGLGEEGLKILKAARDETHLPVVSELLSEDDIDLLARYADMIQIGARNMQNFRLLREAGRMGKPVLLKRGISATIEELLNAAEYVRSEGCEDIVLCERGIRTFERSTRFTLDISAIPVLRQLTHLPVIVDPSHAAGARELVPALARAAAACGAAGIMVEVHPDPSRALSDGPQALTLEMFAELKRDLDRISALMQDLHCAQDLHGAAARSRTNASSA
jgi:3-deoxy-7-phosphoheptulonate synthase